MKNSKKNLRNKAKVMMCTHPLLLKTDHGKNDYVTTEKDKQKEKSRRE
jgi:hypothetical protein